MKISIILLILMKLIALVNCSHDTSTPCGRAMKARYIANNRTGDNIVDPVVEDLCVNTEECIGLLDDYDKAFKTKKMTPIFEARQLVLQYCGVDPKFNRPTAKPKGADQTKGPPGPKFHAMRFVHSPGRQFYNNRRRFYGIPRRPFFGKPGLLRYKSW